MERKTVPFAIKQADLLAQGVIEGYAAVIGNVDDGNDVIDPGAFTKTIAENGARIKMGWQHEGPFGVTTYIAEVGRDALPPAVLARAPGALGGVLVRGQADMTAEDEDRHQQDTPCRGTRAAPRGGVDRSVARAGGRTHGQRQTTHGEPLRARSYGNRLSLRDYRRVETGTQAFHFHVGHRAPARGRCRQDLEARYRCQRVEDPPFSRNRHPILTQPPITSIPKSDTTTG